MSKDETTENKRKRLIFRSEHRGTKEMDIILGTFARENVPNFTEAQLEIYDDLLKHNDPNLYNWILEKDDPDTGVESEVFDMLKAHKVVT